MSLKALSLLIIPSHLFSSASASSQDTATPLLNKWSCSKVLWRFPGMKWKSLSLSGWPLSTSGFELRLMEVEEWEGWGYKISCNLLNFYALICAFWCKGLYVQRYTRIRQLMSCGIENNKEHCILLYLLLLSIFSLVDQLFKVKLLRGHPYRSNFFFCLQNNWQMPVKQCYWGCVV